MSKVFALLAILLILCGVLVIALPREEPASPGPRGIAPSAPTQTSALATVRQIAEQANAPLSIVFGIISLYYSRRTYLNSQRVAGKQ